MIERSIIVTHETSCRGTCNEPHLQHAGYQCGARVPSMCTGAFALAAAGLLDGKRATTHRMAADHLAQRYPKVTVDRNVLFADEGSVITSAGASAGLDMCLHLIARDNGQAFAAHAAKMAVAPLHRDGDQAQFIEQITPAPEASLAPLLAWMTENVETELTIDAIAARVGLSPRTLARRFHQQVGTTPIQWLLAARIRRAQALWKNHSTVLARSLDRLRLRIRSDLTCPLFSVAWCELRRISSPVCMHVRILG